MFFSPFPRNSIKDKIQGLIAFGRSPNSLNTNNDGELDLLILTGTKSDRPPSLTSLTEQSQTIPQTAGHNELASTGIQCF